MSFKFHPLNDPKPGCGFTFYWCWSTKLHGRHLFKETVQAHKDDLGWDPWDVPDEKYK